jgi:hypothetical protein
VNAQGRPAELARESSALDVLILVVHGACGRRKNPQHEPPLDQLLAEVAADDVLTGR